MLHQLPNAICLLRLALVAPIIWTLTHDDPAATLWLFAAAAVSDGADGFLAKRFGWQSRVGALLDPIADKVLLTSVFVTLGVIGLIPLWLPILTVLRDVVIVAGATAYFVVLGPVKIAPARSSKINTACQLAFVLIVVCRQAFSRPSAPIAIALGAAVLFMAVVSGLDYVLRYSRLARAQLAIRSARIPGAPAPGARSS